MKQKLEKEEKSNLIKNKTVEKVNSPIKSSENDETGKTKFKKFNLFFSSRPTRTKKGISRLKKFNHGVKKSESEDQKQVKPSKADLTSETRKTKLDKFKSFFSLCTRKKNNDNPRLIKSNYGIKRSKTKTKNLDKSLRHYIKQKLKWVVLLLITYVTFLGGIVSTPILINHFRATSQNQTEKERFNLKSSQ